MSANMVCIKLHKK